MGLVIGVRYIVCTQCSLNRAMVRIHTCACCVGGGGACGRGWGCNACGAAMHVGAGGNAWSGGGAVMHGVGVGLTCIECGWG